MSGSQSGPDFCARLREADEAYHRVSLGQSVWLVHDQNGERVQYSPANASNLLAYIRRLAPLCPGYVSAAVEMATPRPLRFLF